MQHSFADPLDHMATWHLHGVLGPDCSVFNNTIFFIWAAVLAKLGIYIT